MYNSACAMYLRSYSKVFDILAPIKCIDEEGNTFFVPFATSVKSRREFGPSEVEKELKQMKSVMENCRLKSALCLLVLLDVTSNPLTSSTEINHYDIVRNLSEEIVCKAIAIQDDSFGIN
jgi:hypothetical protein